MTDGVSTVDRVLGRRFAPYGHNKEGIKRVRQKEQKPLSCMVLDLTGQSRDSRLQRGTAALGSLVEKDKGAQICKTTLHLLYHVSVVSNKTLLRNK